MAKRITTGKRDREKLKQQKKQDKQKRKEERQNTGTRSFDEMIAYVDQFGALHTTPQEKPKEEMDVSSIAVSTPKQEDIEIVPLTGRVEHFNTSKGYGFIKDLNSSEKYFFHISEASDVLTEGDRVSFELERGTRGMNAVRISIIKQSNNSN